MAKATREAKVITSWVNPNEPYDAALQRYVARILDPDLSARFLEDFEAFHGAVARLGMVNGLAQVILKVTAPGVPDFYQGTELWDLSLVDPDNRRPVDFAARAERLAALRARAGGDDAKLARELVERWSDGGIKLYTVWKALTIRRAAPELFAEGAYVPLATGGAQAAHLFGFARTRGEAAALVVVPRLTARLTDDGARLPVGRDVWKDAWLELPASLAGDCVHAFTGAAVTLRRRGDALVLDAADLFAEMPVALITRKE